MRGDSVGKRHVELYRPVKVIPCKSDAIVDAELVQIESRAHAATPGPWKVCPDENDENTVPLVCCGPEDEHGGPVCCDPLTEADATFIAHARADVPALVAEVRRLRAERESA